MNDSGLFTYFSFYTVALMLSSCSQLAREEKIPVKDSININTPVNKRNFKKDSIGPGIVYVNESDTSILLKNGEAFVKGHITPKTSPRKYCLNVLAGQTIIATVRPVEKKGNIRINQLQLPDKSFDGPFGDSINYAMKSKGQLTIIIGQNMMSGDPWTGSFILHVRLK